MATALDKYKDKHNQRAERENNKQKCGATFGFFFLEPRRKLCIELKNKKKNLKKEKKRREND